jgi:myo-inositol-1(or 4)-monophosphatase
MISGGLDDRFSLACSIASKAGELARRLFEKREAGIFQLKGHQNYLTEADSEVERFITAQITESFPGDTVFGEEEGGRFSANTWVIDPIDGTANFARGIPHFSISIAYVRDGAPVIGAIVSPMVKELFAARQGGGATLNGRPIRVSPTSDIKQATIELGWSTRRPLEAYAEMLKRVVATGAGILRQGSGALGMAYVAAGRIDGYGELHINSWDVLAGIVLVREAGGWTNDFMANDGLRAGNPILACTPKLREQLIRATGMPV